MKARNIYEKALALINERGEDGEYQPDIKDYEKNAVNLIGILSVSLYELDCRIKGIQCVFDNLTPNLISTLEEDVKLHDNICALVMPYGLAFLLLLEEEPTRAGIFHKQYENESHKLEKLCTKGKRQKIIEVY